jgi:hypothetical protein
MQSSGKGQSIPEIIDFMPKLTEKIVYMIHMS